MNHGSLFSGIGGFDLAAQCMGWQNVFHCEINEFGRKVLSYYWPNAISYEDITTTDFTVHRGTIDILTGGFPCQPFSIAGKRKGTADHRNLWPEMLRVIREVQPTWVVGENVPGLINWSEGLVFEQVQADLEVEGYEIIPFILPACGVNAPHRRDRVWFVARRITPNTNLHGHQLRGFGKDRQEKGESEGERNKREWIWDDSWRISEQGPTPNTTSQGREEWQQDGGQQDAEEDRAGLELRSERLGNDGTVTDPSSAGREKFDTLTQPNKQGYGSRFSLTDWTDWPTQPPVCSRNDGFSARLDGITFSKWRNESIKAAGNAIVPQVALLIFKAIEQHRLLYG